MQLVTSGKHNESIPGKRYFTIGEVSELCDVKSHVLRYWEQEFPMLSPVKRRGNRRYYQRHEVELIRTIRQLLYVEGYTISGASNKLTDLNDSPVGKSSEHSHLDDPDIAKFIFELEQISLILD